MITSKKDYMFYLQADRIALEINTESIKNKLIAFFFPNPVYQFQILLRKCEYYKNCKKGVPFKILYIFLKSRLRKKGLKLGFSIPENVFGPGLGIIHYGTIVVNANAKVGANCRLHPSTCIGASSGTNKAPQIGDNVYIGPGVKVYGNITIGNNIAMSANAAVNSSFLEDNILIGGVPAKKIKEIDISKIIKHLK
jgi:serine O-acetyltransferase